MASRASLALLVVFTACSGGEAAPTATSSTVAPTTTSSSTTSTTLLPTTTSTSTTTTTVPLTDAERIEAARTAFGSALMPGLAAADVVDAAVGTDGRVTLTICAWTGADVFDEVREATYEVLPDGAQLVDSGPVAGECLNSQLVATALETINVHDDYWTSVLSEPDTYLTNPLSDAIFTLDVYTRLMGLVDTWVEGGTYWRGSQFSGGIPDNLVAPLAWRRYDSNGLEQFAIVACRTMDPVYGLYRGDTLVDDYRSDDSAGLHSIVEYGVERDPSTELGWRVGQVDSRIWGDCFRTGDWLGAVNIWKAEPTEWQLLDDVD